MISTPRHPTCAAPSRRALLRAAAAAAGAGLLAAAAPLARAQTADQDPALTQILADFEPGDLEPGAGLIAEIPPLLYRYLKPAALRRRVLTYLVTEHAPQDAPVSWSADAESIDYGHLGPISAEEAAPFILDAEGARRLASTLADVDPARPLIVALRGCRLIGGDARRLRLAPDRPDLLGLRCVLTVVAPDGSIVGFPGATTPSALHAHAQARLKNAGRVACLTPTGLLPMRFGPHRPESAHPQPGALLLDAPLAVYRDYGRNAPTLFAAQGGAWMLDGGRVAQGVHAGSLDAAPFGGVLAYSGSGGLVVAGGHTQEGEPYGPWAEFLRAIRAAGAAQSSPGRAAPRCLLLTGVEAARLLRAPNIAAHRRLRYGSEGPAVATLQRRLALPETGRFTIETQIAVLRRQLLSGDRADGIVTPEWAAQRLDLLL